MSINQTVIVYIIVLGLSKFFLIKFVFSASYFDFSSPGLDLCFFHRLIVLDVVTNMTLGEVGFFYFFNVLGLLTYL